MVAAGGDERGGGFLPCFLLYSTQNSLVSLVFREPTHFTHCPIVRNFTFHRPSKLEKNNE